MEIAILITHYKRPSALENLLADIERELSQNDTAYILIHDDCSGIDQSFFNQLEQSMLVSNIKINTLIADHNHGKRDYFQVIDKLYRHIHYLNFDYCFQFPEDIRLPHDFFQRTFCFMQESNAICLNLLADQRKSTKQWTNVQPKQISDELWLTGWVDMIFCATPQFFETLNYMIQQVPDSWFTNPDKSSGVGAQISKRIINAGYHFHQVDKSLVHHGDYDSVMHPELRKLEPLKEVRVARDDRYIVASLASIPSRVDALKIIVDIICPQVDELFVYLNDYDEIPAFLNRKAVHVYRSQSYADLGDVGKFFASLFLDKNTYHLTIDDDIKYPDNYVQFMCDQVDLFDKNAIVTMHGRVFKQLPVHSYYMAEVEPFLCTKDHGRNKYLHVPGSGVMAYHTSLIQFKIDDFEHINMSDIYVARKAQLLNIPIVGVAHSALSVMPVDDFHSIYHQCRRDDSIQTKVVNAINWTLNKL